MGFKYTLLLCIACFAVVAINATAVMRRPDNYKNSPTTTKPNTTLEARDLEERHKGKASVAYFTNWGIYGANFQPQDIVTDSLSHILYSFADVDPWSGAIRLTDSWADEEKHYDGDSWTESGTNLYGCLKQLYLIKLANRKIKAGHFAFVTSESSRTTFVSTAVTLIEDYANAAEGQGFADLFTELRTAFDNLANSKGDKTPYELSAAVAAGPNNYANLAVPQMNAALTYWNLMSYDYSGDWLDYTDNQANLYGGARTGVSTDAAVQHFISAGADAWKINMGIPLYGRIFENTDGLGASYSGTGAGTLESGIYSYNVLPLGGAQVFENTDDVSSYSYDWSCRELVSYDTPNIVALKAKYINDCGLAGSMFWELSTDKVGSESLVGAAAGVLGTLDKTKNHINYPNSKWDNIRSNMGQW
ncbi:glycoside hydrolase family 18 protein [Armillaria mellea]|nr:glycoside hydrolase family 18 protein [Armillaria mellea]